MQFIIASISRTRIGAPNAAASKKTEAGDQPHGPLSNNFFDGLRWLSYR
jgi:hypothetical protein